jgi:hypothetical protein
MAEKMAIDVSGRTVSRGERGGGRGETHLVPTLVDGEDEEAEAE